MSRPHGHLVDVTSGANGTDDDDAEPGADLAGQRPLVDSAEHVEALRERHAWRGEWAETARAVIERRDVLLRLGLARRKQPTKKSAPGEAIGRKIP